MTAESIELPRSIISSVQPKADITQHEIAALRTRYNLADAHTHQNQSASQRAIVASLPDIWYAAANQTQYKSEQEFIHAFYSLHGQHRALKRHDDIYLVYAASIAMHITATYLQKKNMRVGLIEPCFDNLHDLMKHMQVPMVPLREELFQDPARIYDNLVARVDSLDAVFLVDPNNPTGSSLLSPTDHAFREVVRFCVDYDKLLVMDLCFASFILASGQPRPDVYEILEDSGVRYIAMEDTGKTWPLQDAKCATLMCSRDLNDDIYPIVTSVLLNVSPFVLKLVTEYVLDSERDGFASVRDLLDTNREIARSRLGRGLLRYRTPAVKTSVAWFEITDPKWSADALQSYLLTHSVYVLSGKYFYWSNPARGQRYIRIALARETPVFASAIDAISDALAELQQ
ncbi:TPA: aspartate/tyrosine/aromatic aminotransferase [Burkholderia vietnamiensis]|uniref:aminotransferase class I/II-fold pyridoxal phosphate-dependent enzyme n=1 Tax=Burkholderia vietnamiensis TaxID=60552 RepID=UPI001BA325E7|nr:aminotransferase class I/II-fold pyridoxal phosphate-dependent enzyme [Burkholderia vietnamiensis]MBR7910782.1 aspartate/tyrosine/aromatic aminotransferase [Burkholderia vietnamiensis]HDR9277416.1 aspartate/tyrosine/aromatic aminotransferase [Burkholderia vietnamiensis]